MNGEVNNEHACIHAESDISHLWLFLFIIVVVFYSLSSNLHPINKIRMTERHNYLFLTLYRLGHNVVKIVNVSER